MKPRGPHRRAVRLQGKRGSAGRSQVALAFLLWVAPLEYFVNRFVWGKHQGTDVERPYPYGIYGADSWKENRFADRGPLVQGISRPGGPSACRMWRTFDYTTYFALSWSSGACGGRAVRAPLANGPTSPTTSGCTGACTAPSSGLGSPRKTNQHPRSRHQYYECHGDETS